MEESSGNALVETLHRIVEKASNAGLVDVLLIGGNAVVAHGVPRFTRDINFVIPERDLGKWRQMLEDDGHLCFHATSAFAQFEDKSGGRPRVDLMIVDEVTWSKLDAEAVDAAYSDGIPARVAAVEHIIAMKLKAVRATHRRSDAVDWSDIVELTMRNKLDPENHDAFRELVIKFGSERLLGELIDEIEERKRELPE